jgi:hypothetical protein
MLFHFGFTLLGIAEKIRFRFPSHFFRFQFARFLGSFRCESALDGACHALNGCDS